MRQKITYRDSSGRPKMKTYDTRRAELIETRPDGIQVYRRKGRGTGFFLYNPEGTTPREQFFELPNEEAMKYIPENTQSRMATTNSNTIRFTPHEHERIKTLAFKQGMPMNRFVMMLVDKYEADLSED